MKKNVFFVVMLGAVLALGVMVIGCNTGAPGGGGDGAFTITVSGLTSGEDVEIFHHYRNGSVSVSPSADRIKRTTVDTNGTATVTYVYGKTSSVTWLELAERKQQVDIRFRYIDTSPTLYTTDPKTYEFGNKTINIEFSVFQPVP